MGVPVDQILAYRQMIRYHDVVDDPKTRVLVRCLCRMGVPDGRNWVYHQMDDCHDFVDGRRNRALQGDPIHVCYQMKVCHFRGYQVCLSGKKGAGQRRVCLFGMKAFD
jgi:hypothetical protein